MKIRIVKRRDYEYAIQTKKWIFPWRFRTALFYGTYDWILYNSLEQAEKGVEEIIKSLSQSTPKWEVVSLEREVA